MASLKVLYVPNWRDSFKFPTSVIPHGMLKHDHNMIKALLSRPDLIDLTLFLPPNSEVTGVNCTLIISRVLGRDQNGRVKLSHGARYRELDSIADHFDVIIDNMNLSSAKIFDYPKLIKKLVVYGHGNAREFYCGRPGGRAQAIGREFVARGGRHYSVGAKNEEQILERLYKSWSMNKVELEKRDVTSSMKLFTGWIDINLIEDGLEFNPHGTNVSIIGRATPQKRVADTLFIPEVTHIVSCSEHLEPAYTKRMRECGDSRLYWEISRPEVMSILRGTKIYIHPSMNESNGFSAFEAASHGAIVIHDGYSSSSEFLKNSGAEEVIPELRSTSNQKQRAKLWSQKISEVDTSVERRKSIFDYYQKEYTLEKYFDRVYSIISTF